MTMTRPLVDVPYSINENDPNWTPSAATTAGTGDGAAEAKLGEFVCPVGLTVVVLPVSSFAAYLLDNEAAPAESGDGTAIRIVHQDAAGGIVIDRIKTVYSGVKDFADQNVLRRFDDRFAIGEKEKLIIYVIPLTGVSLNPAGSRFEIRCRKVFKLLSI